MALVWGPYSGEYGPQTRAHTLVLVINELLDELNSYKEFDVIAFADDIFIILKASASFHFKDPAVTYLQIISNWANRHQLQFSLNKCNFTMIKRGKNISHIHTIRFQRGKITYKKELK